MPWGQFGDRHPRHPRIPADRRLHLFSISEGRVVAEGTPDEIHNSTDPFVHQFVNAEADGPVPFHYPAGDYATALWGGAA